MNLIKVKIQCTHSNGWKFCKIKKLMQVCVAQTLKTVTFKLKRHICLKSTVMCFTDFCRWMSSFGVLL